MTCPYKTTFQTALNTSAHEKLWGLLNKQNIDLLFPTFENIPSKTLWDWQVEPHIIVQCNLSEFVERYDVEHSLHINVENVPPLKIWV